MLKIILAILILVAIVILGTVGTPSLQKQLSPFALYQTAPQAKAAILNHTFNVTVVKDEKEKQIGLSEKTSLAENEGMLFLYDEPGEYGFWMKNMKISIDIIFIRDKKIVTIYHNVTPPVSPNETPPIYKPEEPADMVLEIQSGLSQKYGFQKGDSISIEGL